MITHPKKIEDVSINETEDGYVIYDPKKDTVHFLNNTAVFVLELCTGEHTVDRIARMMKQSFNLKEEPQAEVKDIIERFWEQGLIE